MISLKKLISENVLGDLPSSKLMKMKWNPVTEGNDDLPMDKMDSAEMEPFREAAPKMRVSAQAEEVGKTITIVSRIENGMKAFNQSAHSHVKGDFKKALKALADLKFKISRHS